MNAEWEIQAEVKKLFNFKINLPKTQHVHWELGENSRFSAHVRPAVGAQASIKSKEWMRRAIASLCYRSVVRESQCASHVCSGALVIFCVISVNILFCYLDGLFHSCGVRLLLLLYDFVPLCVWQEVLHFIEISFSRFLPFRHTRKYKYTREWKIKYCLLIKCDRRIILWQI